MSAREEAARELNYLADEGIRHPWKGYIVPFRVIGNLYFVGTIPASCHMIDTGEGQLLVDTALPQSCYLILEGIRWLGFDPMDIRWIVHSHGHYDHISSTRALVALTGAKTYISRPDAQLCTGERDLTWAREMGTAFYEAFEPDVLIDDGDVLEFGNTRVECLLTPGHSEGTLTLLWNIEGAGRPLTDGMHGGTGHNTLDADWLRKNHMPMDMPEIFRRGLRRAARRHVDVMVGNHTGHNHMLEKLERMRSGAGENPFIDPGEWQRFLAAEEQKLDKMLAEARAAGEYYQ